MQTDIVQPAHRLGKLPPVPAGRAKKRASEMLAISELVPSCLEIARLAAETPTAVPAETGDLLNIRTKGRVELMSKLARPNGDDYPEAASKHLRDAAALLAAARPDGAAYLSGYVVECSLKSIYQLQMGNALGNSHSLTTLHSQVSAVAAVAGAKTAKYLGPVTAGILGSPVAAWHPVMRYKCPSMNAADASSWHGAAAQVFQETIAQMHLDGEL
ncbi:hypothetical protein QZM97_28765 [Burkholderia orbicola]|uniref:hypothetical protein n=2 Tax=Burkholderia TaxID=32008 RepID=UPI001CAD947F|nr:hypothetical protein [Burkholderia cepacia]MDN7994079.1 hypothetical protein [Burkholderia orbicola]CAG9273418.1 hypothetical protein BCEP4_800053 [Burkholderia cepacia]